MVEETAKGALLQGQVPDAEQLAAAAKLLQQIASNPHVTELVDTAGKKTGTAISAGVLSSAAATLKNVLPTPVKAVKKVSKIVAQPTVRRSNEWKTILASEGDKHLQELYESVDWAQRKSDVRLCKDLDPAVHTGSPSVAGPTIGDILALCLAKATGDAARCGQIDASTASALKSVCETELEGRA